MTNSPDTIRGFESEDQLPRQQQDAFADSRNGHQGRFDIEGEAALERWIDPAKTEAQPQSPIRINGAVRAGEVHVPLNVDYSFAQRRLDRNNRNR